jgi:hypothetical protein
VTALAAWFDAPRCGNGAGAQGRSKFGGRAESITKPAPSLRSASAPRSRQTLRPTIMAAQPGGASRGHDEGGARAILLQGIRRQRVGHEAAVGEPAEARGRIAGDAVVEARIAKVAAVGIGGEPFPRRKRIAAGVVEGEPAVRPAHCESPAVGGNKDVRHGCARRPDGGEGGKRHAAPAQRRLQQADDQEARSAEEERPGAEGGDASEGAGEARATASIQSMP